jgi:gamma-glutamyltranspeptidase
MKADRGLAVAALFSLAALPLTPQVRHTMFPPVRGTHEMVGAANNLEVEAGFRILTQGGNAIDAGVATVLAAAVTEQSRFGIGGEIPILLKPVGKPAVAISGIGTAPAKATHLRSPLSACWQLQCRAFLTA